MPTAAGLYYAENNTAVSDCPPVILIHGCGSDHLCWPSEIRRLPGFHVLAVDLPGHGKSYGLAQQSIELCSKKLIEWMDSLNIFRAVLIGHSMGGAIALTTAVCHSERIAALGLIASAAYLNIPSDILENLTHFNTTPLALNALQSRLFSPITPLAVINKTKDQLAALRPGILYADYQASANYDVRPIISQVQTPVWIAAGTKDQLIPISFVRFLSTSLPNTQLCLIEGAGHLVMLEEPKIIAQHLSKFLNDLYRNTESEKGYA